MNHPVQMYIPYQLRVKLKQIDPILDHQWQQRLSLLLASTAEHLHCKIEDDYLKPKNIHWNYLSQLFEFKGHIGLHELHSYIQHSGLLQLAQKIRATFQYLEKYQTDVQIADYLETITYEINSLELQDQKDIQAQQLLKSAFLYDAALSIQQINFSVTQNFRGLTSDQVRCFIFEVFMKSEILGSWFAHILPSEYAQQELSIFQDYFSHEQRVRDFEIIPTSDYYFIIGSSGDSRVSSYSIRRFLSEENFGVANKFYISGLILDPKQIDVADYLENFKQQMGKMIGLQRQMNPHIVELIESLHHYNQYQLREKITQIIEIKGFSIDHLINEHLTEIEKDLCVNILEPFQNGLKNSIQQPDELEFCFLNIRRLMTELLHSFEVFSQEPAIQFNPHARQFKYRLIAYLNLLKQRRAYIFVQFEDQAHYRQHLNLVTTPLEQLQDQVNGAIEQSRLVQQQLRQLERDAKQSPKTSFFKRLISKSENNYNQINELKTSLKEIQHRCYLEIIRIQKQYSQHSLYLESKNLISAVDPKVRHYAFADGENGVTRLPLLLQLPENRDSFNLQSIALILNQDVVHSAKHWVID